MALGFYLCLLLSYFTYVQCNIVLTQSDSVTTKPTETQTLSCSVTGFDINSYYMAWVKQVPGKGLEWLLSNQKPTSTNHYAPGVQDRFTPSKDSTTFYLKMNNLKTEDTAMYYCARQAIMGLYLVSYFDYWGQGTMVTVTAAEPSAPTLFALLSSCGEPNTEGLVTVGCLAMNYSPEKAILSWTKDDQSITSGFMTYPSVFNKKGTYTLSSQLTIPESEVESSKVYCVVRHSGSAWETVRKPLPDRWSAVPPTVILTQSSTQEILSSKHVTAVCLITGFRPKPIDVQWLKGGLPLKSGFVTSPPCEENGNFSASSRLEITYREWFNGAVYTCSVTHKASKSIQSKNITSSPDCSPPGEPEVTILPPSQEQVLLEATVTLTCVVSDAPNGANVSWTREQQPLKPEIAVQPGEGSDSLISKVDISTQAWLSGDTFYCVVSHQDLPTPKRASIHKEIATNPQEPSVFVLLPLAEEISAQRSMTLTCLVRGFSPREIFVKWTVNNKTLNSSGYKNTEVMAENDSSSFFMYSMLSIKTEDWTSGASYSCVVGHEAIPLKIMSRTVNKSSGKPSFVNISLVLMDTVNSCQ